MGLPHVTDILKGAGLIDTTFFTAEARQRGTAVHLATQYHDEADLDEASVAPEVQPYLAAYRLWLRDMRPGISSREVKLTTDEYQGTADGICWVPSDKEFNNEFVYDIKSGGHAHWHRLQLSAYQKAIASSGLNVRRANLYLRSDGTYRWQPYRAIDDREDWQDFLRALRAYRKGAA